MYVISFDMGISNLAYCVLDLKDDHKTHIVDWKRVNIQTHDKKNIELLSDALIDVLDEIVHNIDDYKDMVFLIENQPVFKAPTMKSLQMVIFTYAMIMKKNVESSISIKFMSASSKLRYIEKKKKIKLDKNYKTNKNASIDFTYELLSGDERLLNILNSEKKKDDLCDTYLQALSFIDS